MEVIINVRFSFFEFTMFMAWKGEERRRNAFAWMILNHGQETIHLSILSRKRNKWDGKIIHLNMN
jgi:hypothetical protein